MKQKRKNIKFFSILARGAFICSLLLAVFAFSYFQANAATNPDPGTVGYACSNNLSCNQGLSCSGVTKQCGTSCTADTNCANGQYCDLSGSNGGVCITGTAPGGVQTPPNPVNPSPATPITCPTGLENVNGICLPPSQYTTGIAGSTTLSGFIITVIKILLSFAGVIAVVMLVIGGYWYMAAGGNEEMSEKGKKTIINFVLGLVVIILAYTIVTIIAATLTGADKLLQ